ncbi:MAG TPA: universal stress protein [Nocardioides sp.]|uniref:universal stress protein n=1 Tax=Nocardioides sp. TaxID=35761 RepID=UPI002C38BFBC|nr:universal stress protein [Nocardioides sp.]HTW13894.1 universal stress protein [Nocardioides sp.]
MTDIDRSAAGTDDVVVGVDGSAASVTALRYAAAAAARFGGRLRVLHVLPEYVEFGYPIAVAEVTGPGDAVLRTVLEEAGPIDESITVTTAMRRGPIGAALVSYARAARLLVVGADRRNVAARILTGNVSTNVAASSAAPVVVVPESWRGTDRHGVVLAGVKGRAHADAVIAAAFDVAQEQEARLVILHAWKLPSGYDDVIVGRVADEAWDERARSELGALVAAGSATRPGIEVTLHVVHDQAAHALVEASSKADEVILVRRAHGIPAATHLGATARAVLRESVAPVRIVPPGAGSALPTS